MRLRVVGDADNVYLVTDDESGDGETEVVQLARFESERAVRLYLKAIEATIDDAYKLGHGEALNES